jgi:hypothetical protein
LDNEVTVKRYRQEGHRVWLMPENPEFAPIQVDLREQELAIEGGEASAGVAIQKVNAGLDAGEIVRAGEVAVAGKRYGQVDDEVQALGIELYLDAILAVKHGRATFRPQPPGEPVLYRQPSARQIIELAWRVLTGGNGPK